MDNVTTTVIDVTGIFIALDDVTFVQMGRKTDPISTETLQKFHIVMTGFWIVICIVGISMNAVNLRTFLKMGLEDSVTISFFLLALSDFNICSIAFVELLAFMCAVLERELKLWFYLPPLVPSFMFMCVRRTFNTTTILITTFLALQRCLCVVLPFHVKGMFTRFRTYVFMTVIFSFSVTCSSLFIWRHRVVPFTNEAWNATQLIIYVPPGSGPYMLLIEVVLGIGLNIACQIIVLLCLVMMRFFLRKSIQFRQAATSNNAEKSTAVDQGKSTEKAKETQAIIQVALVSVIFIVTNSPYLGFGIANTLIPEFGLNDTFHNLYHLVHNMMFTAELLNSSVNFVVYYKYNSKFRKHCFKSKP